MSILAIIITLSVSHSTWAIPLPAPQLDVSEASSPPLSFPSATSSTAATITTTAKQVSSIEDPERTSITNSQALKESTSSLTQPVGDGAFSDESSASSGEAAVSSSGGSDSSVSALNGMSTKQLAMYCGIGLAVFIALGAGWFFFQKYQKKKKGQSDDDNCDGDKSDLEDSEDSDEDSEDEKPVRTRKERCSASLPSRKTYSQPSYEQPKNMAGTGAHGNKYENALRHNTALDIYPMEPTLSNVKSPPTVATKRNSKEKPTKRASPLDVDSDDTSDDSDEETEEEKRRRKRRAAKRKAKRST